jgi:Sugar-transfer associated ATP-grasp
MQEPPILVTSTPARTFDLGQALRVTAAARGISTTRLGAEIIRRQMGRQRLSPQEYFLFGAHRPGLTAAERGMFIGNALGSRMFNALAPKNFSIAGALHDKLLCDILLRGFGFLVPHIQAVAGLVPSRLPYSLLSDPAALTRFLDHEAVLPAFGKPVAEAGSLGATSIIARGSPGRLLLGDGRDVSSAQFAQEVFRHYIRGYVFQDMLVPNPQIAGLTGPVLATIRLVTLRVGAKILVLYGGLKWPGKGAMVDGWASLKTLEAAVDLPTGQIRRLQDPQRFGGTDLAENPVNDAPVVGQTVPFWEEAVALAVAAHEVFPDQRIIGGDFGVALQGLVIVELNTHPGMGFYQKSTARGVWNPELAPLFTEALAEAGHRRPTRALPLPWSVRA